ncbi:hypothetical protein DES52_12319 [Deinococcus yavapaiensis KR-236]|uniref:Uncharacterized protein n=1 Tax=Deinococcus yavapaiensis KR-236 TaxID=694435 RepID=A0A318S3T1_9DEIO|nr:hypothetical protein DES52_12319 [Deinococcus yavapaiensis KR-236]
MKFTPLVVNGGMEDFTASETMAGHAKVASGASFIPA